VSDNAASPLSNPLYAFPRQKASGGNCDREFAEIKANFSLKRTFQPQKNAEITQKNTKKFILTRKK